ncbi:hypothetical protein [Nocardioides sambongensis]|nr:hypothetical protein [Nocardioides sambongensis]
MTAAFSVTPGVATLDEALGSAAANLECTARALAAVWSVAQRSTASSA